MTKRSAVWIQTNKQIRRYEKDLSMTADDHVSVVKQLTGKSSLGDCSDQEMVAVATELKERLPSTNTDFKPSRHAHVRKIWKLWGLLKKAGALKSSGSQQALLALVNNIRPEDRKLDKIEQLDWLTADAATPIIEALKAMCVRKGVEVRS